jgi:hypothetical protein
MIEAATSEHIFLEAPELEPAFEADRATALRASFAFHNRMRRVRTEIRLYDEGYLGIRERGAGRDPAEWRVALRHLDPRPVLSCRMVTPVRNTMLCSSAAAALLAGLAYVGVASAIMLSLAAAALVVASLSAAVFFYRREERVQFVTRHGRVTVVELVANVGCIRACRAVVPQLVAAIKNATKGENGNDKTVLRAELREHYRLRDGGVLSTADCIGAIQRILSRFD